MISVTTYISESLLWCTDLTFTHAELITCKVSAGNLCPMLPEGDVRGLGLTLSVSLTIGAPGRFLIALEFVRTVPA